MTLTWAEIQPAIRACVLAVLCVAATCAIFALVTHGRQRRPRKPLLDEHELWRMQGCCGCEDEWTNPLAMPCRRCRRSGARTIMDFYLNPKASARDGANRKDGGK